MDWVMVPVPEELIAEVGTLLFQLRFQGDVVPWGPDLMDEHLLSLGDEPRAALCTVAARALADDPIDDIELAASLQMSVRELFGVVRDANDVTVGTSPGDLLQSSLVEEVDEETGSTRRRRVLVMYKPLAAMVREREDALGLRSPGSTKS